MFQIRKRSLPTPKPQGILRKHDAAKKTRRSVGFVDEIGKPLAEYRDIPSLEKHESPDHHEKTSGKFMSTWRVDNKSKWNLIPVKTAKPVRSGRSETGLIEEMRLEENNISRAPLFGSFDAIEPGNLYLDAIIRAREPVPIIPVDDCFDSPSQNEAVQSVQPPPQQQQQQNTYAQVFEDPTPAKMSLETLLAQLRNRGLLPGEQAPVDSFLPPVGLVIPQMSLNGNQRGRNERRGGICTFHINRRSGCNRGDACRFRHDDEQRDVRQREKQKSSSYGGWNENWRLPVRNDSSGPPDARKVANSNESK